MAKVLLGLSGGVDSAVALHLLIKQGHQVTAAFMRNWDSMANNDFLGNPNLGNSICPQEEDYNDALAVAKAFNVELIRIDYVKEYWDDVFSKILEEYKLGRTPNPDILCNKHIKFDAFLKYATNNGFDYIATGHYASKGIIEGKQVIKKSLDKNKDQSYFLSQLNHYQIEKVLFPLAELNKTEIRKIAIELNLKVAKKKDSTGICFIGERNFKDFLANYLPLKKGDIIDIETGKVIGEHQGSMYYTIGQRKGLGIGGINGKDNPRWYVVKKDVIKNIVYVTDNKEEKYLYSSTLIIDSLNILISGLENGLKCYGKFRYRQNDEEVVIKLVKDQLIVQCPFLTKAATPGQQAVFYLDDCIIAAGTIMKVE